jgi:hypothetical protein
VLFEKNDRIGGLLRYGIPDFKLEKWIIDRRLEQMAAEGVDFRANHVIGDAPLGAGNRAATKVEPGALLSDFDAVVLAGGAEMPRDLPIPGRQLQGIEFAMDFLPLQNRRVAGDPGVPDLWASGKHVVIIGGGDTGSDCVGTSNRHGAASVTQFELLPMPPDADRNPVWPYWPVRLRTSSSHEEGRAARLVHRDQGVRRRKRPGPRARAVRLEWKDGKMCEIPGRSSACRRTWCCSRWDSSLPVQSISTHSACRRTRAATRKRRPMAPDAMRRRAEGLRRGRHAARPVARRLGDPRGPAMRARGGRVPDGPFRVAAVDPGARPGDRAGKSLSRLRRTS